ncbi:MAG TPA: ATP-binding protein [Gemmatimonadaceae bacterium]|nr:ATP-binding protein [Gemmatimonadaceae bacterium]
MPPLPARNSTTPSLARHARLLDAVQAAALTGGWELDLTTGTLHWTEATHRLHDTTPADYAPTVDTAMAFYTEECRPRILAALAQATGGEATGWDLDLEIETASGRRLSVRTVGSVQLEDGKPARITGAIQELSARRHLEAQLRQAQKMEAVGQLAGGIAHDLNNILTVIQGHAAFLEDDVDAGSEPAASALQIRQAATRAATLVRQLLVFGDRHVPRPRAVDLNVLAAAMAEMLQRIMAEDIQVQLVLAPGPVFTTADASLLEQAVLNLAANARDAMPGGGRLLIETAGVTIDDASAHDAPDARAGAFACLSVGDTGDGISREALPHIFEPFFTTKSASHGTGLGLANVRDIVRQHDGWVDVRSEPGGGTTFRLYFPRAMAAVTPPAGASEAANALPPTATILLVEDEAPVRALARTILERAGYRVLEARAGAGALVAWEGHAGDVDLLLTDVMMPDGVSGVDLAQRLRGVRPDLKVLCMSGYQTGNVATELDRMANVGFLAKPFTPEELTAAVARSLAPPPADPAERP